MPFGAELAADGVRFRLWAPGCARVGLVFADEAPRAMRPGGGGWYELLAPEARAGTRYRFALPDGRLVPDPASRRQPDDAHGPSEVVDPAAYAWRDGCWAGRPWAETVLYELHVGAFTPAGTFAAASERLDHLAALGVTALEIMPVADFPGRRNWGYDGVLPFAVDGTYGGPDDFKAFVDAAHARGIMVLLDVVYNHFGPDGNYLGAYAPQFFTGRHHTPWGKAIDYDGPESGPVRAFVVHNALYWLDEYHLDGLRLDAVHAIVDDSPEHILDELARTVRERIADRYVHLVLENEENASRLLVRDRAGQPLRYTAQWNDDVHHGLHVAATGESAGYYADYHDPTRLGRALAEGFAFQGEVMPFRERPRGEPSTGLPPDAFIAFIQNHDQIGNRAFGERLTALAPPRVVRAVAAISLLLPQIPLLFMGEEWGAAQPFPFFCDFHGELAAAVRNGRRNEFARFAEFADPANRERIPDPNADATFASAKLRWDDLVHEAAAAWLDWHRRILDVRRREIVPLVSHIGPHAGAAACFGERTLVARWRVGRGEALVLHANLGAIAAAGVPAAAGRTIWQEGAASAGDRLEPWSVRWSREG